MNTEKYKEYKSFTPLLCKACNKPIYNDIHDELCEDCLSEVGLLEDVWAEDYEKYLEL